MTGSIDLESRTVSRVAVLGRDYRGVNFEMLCQQGDTVQAGGAVMRDARRPQIYFTAPLGGRVVRIERGARRRLIALHIEVGEDAGAARIDPPKGDESAAQRTFMLENGAWTSLRTRPFGNIPDPDAEPAAIFVTALDNEPMAPEPRPIIDAFRDEFEAAVNLLAKISAAPIYVCHAVDHAIKLDVPQNVRCVSFSGGREAGLPGTHINRLCPIGFSGGEVWYLGYQDVIALGHQLQHGAPWLQRVVALGGSAASNPRNLLLPPGASIDELLADETGDAPLRVFSGSEHYGRALKSDNNFLGAGQRQISFVDIASAESGVVADMLPGDWLDAVAPPGILPVPLMRALQLGDAERARELGALELVEEDVAALSRACVSGNDYGLLLRGVLDQLEAGR
ncbi:MAG: hypothetical protein JSU67_13400 [Gammaproteobacteria bacterium]|nr:MAG: hypothetical protein JSU67_13400 [Gammaproteobacteria bacterium]